MAAVVYIFAIIIIALFEIHTKQIKTPSTMTLLLTEPQKRVQIIK